MARRNKRPPLVKAADDKPVLHCSAESVEWLQASEADPDKPKRFSMTAYTGGQMSVGYYGPVVLDLAGIEAAADSVPILLDHDTAQIVGHSDALDIKAASIKVAGVVSGGGRSAEEVLIAAKRGFPWKASVGVRPSKTEYVAEGASAKANGKTFKGPLTIVRGGTLVEVSFVPLAADSKTSVTVAAQAANLKEKKMDKEFVQWLVAKGFSEEEIQAMSEAKIAWLKASFDLEHAKPEPAAKPEAKPVAAEESIAALRASHAAETTRIAAIRKICAGSHAELEAAAIADGRDPKDVELEIMRASRPTGPAIHVADQSLDAKTIEASLLMQVMHPEASLLKAFGQQTVEKAHRHRRARLKEIISLCCAMEGRNAPGFGATDNEYVKAAFSTVSLPGILSNVGHKVMLEAYAAVPGAAGMLCRKLTASDFKTHTGYRMTGDMKFEEVGSNGELAHGKLSESSYTYSVKTYGRIFGLTRQMQINDDMGAFAEIPRAIGRGSALMVERLFWTLVHANTGNFFHATNANLITKVLGSEGLKLAVKALEEQTDSEGDPILINGTYLVVPPALRETAEELRVSTTVNTGGAATKEKVPSANIYKDRYATVSSPYISNTSFHASATATQYYLWGNPADVAAFGLAYLNGQETPAIEDVAVSGEFLGNAWRGYLDVGVCQIDHRGAVKSTGLVS
jgi:hypothetical protein